ncbi:MAG: hypothetical protein AB1758_10265, partial [Candidatus Eremiobacterota bacterium]
MEPLRPRLTGLPVGSPPPGRPLESEIRDLVEAGAEFYLERGWRWPWQDRLAPALPAQVAEKLTEATLKVRPKDSQVLLPLNSVDDVRELSVFASRAPASDLRHADLARGLQAAAQAGWRFYSEEAEVGLYGAYNALTDLSHGLTGVQAGKGDERLALTMELARELARFEGTPCVWRDLEAAGYRFFRPDGTPVSAFSASRGGAQVGQREPWFSADLLVADRWREQLAEFQAVGHRGRFEDLCRWDRSQPETARVARTVLKEVPEHAEAAFASLRENGDVLAAVASQDQAAAVRLGLALLPEALRDRVLPDPRAIRVLLDGGPVSSLPADLAVPQGRRLLEGLDTGAARWTLQAVPPDSDPSAARLFDRVLANPQAPPDRDWAREFLEATHGASALVGFPDLGLSPTGRTQLAAFLLDHPPEGLAELALDSPADQAALGRHLVGRLPSTAATRLVLRAATGPEPFRAVLQDPDADVRDLAEELLDRTNPAACRAVLEALPDSPIAVYARELAGQLKGPEAVHAVARAALNEREPAGLLQASLTALERLVWKPEHGEEDRLLLGKSALRLRSDDRAALGLRLAERLPLESALEAVRLGLGQGSLVDALEKADERLGQALAGELGVQPDSELKHWDSRRELYVQALRHPERSPLENGIEALGELERKDPIVGQVERDDRLRLARRLLEQARANPERRDAAELALKLVAPGSSGELRALRAALEHPDVSTPASFGSLGLTLLSCLGTEAGPALLREMERFPEARADFYRRLAEGIPGERVRAEIFQAALAQTGRTRAILEGANHQVDRAEVGRRLVAEEGGPHADLARELWEGEPAPQVQQVAAAVLDHPDRAGLARALVDKVAARHLTRLLHGQPGCELFLELTTDSEDLNRTVARVVLDNPGEGRPELSRLLIRELSDRVAVPSTTGELVRKVLSGLDTPAARLGLQVLPDVSVYSALGVGRAVCQAGTADLHLAI